MRTGWRLLSGWPNEQVSCQGPALSKRHTMARRVTARRRGGAQAKAVPLRGGMGFECTARSYNANPKFTPAPKLHPHLKTPKPRPLTLLITRTGQTHAPYHSSVRRAIPRG